jgi:hypothetical protein
MVPDDTIISMPTSGADITAFKNITEESIGQLYAYYYSETSVVLGTRSATSSDGTIQMAVGVSAVANDMYVCIVENFINATSRIDVDIRTLTTPLSAPTYLRFSTIPVQVIQRQLYLDSEEFVFAMFESMVGTPSYMHFVYIL